MTRKITENRRKAVFQYELLGGRSDFKDVIWSRMESLEVVDVFAPLMNVLWPLHQISAQYQFSSFSTFLLVDFLISTFEMLARSSSGWILDYFLDKAWSYLFQIEFAADNSHYLILYLNFCDSCSNLKILYADQM